MKGIFDTKPDSGYDDELVERYQFPNRNYAAAARQIEGDWVILRRPRRGGSDPGYMAVAKVTRIVADLSDASRSYAYLSDFLPFDRTVPLGGDGGYFELRLRAVIDRSRIGAALQGRSVRTISDGEFSAIVLAGLEGTFDPANARRLELDPGHADPETLALVQAPVEEQERRIAQILLNRKIRDANFRKQVCEAYDDRCAVTRLRIVNGGGKSEVQAAHIWAVKDGGPDVVQNGIAQSGTVHWLFDRGLISLSDDFGLLVSHNKVPSELRPLFQSQLERIHLPADQRLWPSKEYVRRHREAYLNS